ncbi:hypothetical protein V1264_016144 [Littorina saxatilis]|uniref:Uncharacterized protein n=1 Tax=Littorina saxatilis TaxID=31220 RepID=A0AAN9BLS3_9CAEN
MHHLQLSFSVLVCVFLSVCTQVRHTEAEEHTADSIEELKNACKKDGLLLQITEAFFCNQPDYSPCDHNCTPVDESQPSGLCFAPSDTHRLRGCTSEASCRLRLSLDELNKVYKAVDTEESPENVDELFDRRGKYVFHYVCGDGECILNSYFV